MFTLLDFTRAAGNFWRLYGQVTHEWQSSLQSLTAVQTREALTLNRSVVALWTTGGSTTVFTTSGDPATALRPTGDHRDAVEDNPDHGGEVLEVFITRLLDEDLVLTR